MQLVMENAYTIEVFEHLGACRLWWRLHIKFNTRKIIPLYQIEVKKTFLAKRSKERNCSINAV